MAEFPALPLWTDAYLADTRHLSTLEHGAYLLLLMEAWRRPNCDLPDDDRVLARLAGLTTAEWEDAKPIVMEMWTHDGRSKTWRQKRLSSERTYVKKKSRSQRDKATKRWKDAKKDDAAALPGGCPDDAPTPTPTPTPTTNLLSPDGDCASSDALKVEHVAEYWNEIASRIWRKRHIRDVTPSRRQLVNARIAQYSLDDFATVFANVEASPFLRGERKWRGATFDWLMKRENFQKTLEGNYDG